jgi:hypothetical protein
MRRQSSYSDMTSPREAFLKVKIPTLSLKRDEGGAPFESFLTLRIDPALILLA